MVITYRNEVTKIKLKNMSFKDKNNKILKNLNNNFEHKKNNFISKFLFNEKIKKSNKTYATCNKDLKHMEYFLDKIFNNNEIIKKVRNYKDLVNFYSKYNYIIINLNMIKTSVLKNKKKKNYLFEYKNKNEALKKKDAENFQNTIKEKYMKRKKYNKKFIRKIRNTNKINKSEKINKEKNILRKKKITYNIILYKNLAIFLDDTVKKNFFFEENKVSKSYIILISKKRNNDESVSLEIYKYNKINFIKKYPETLSNMFTYLSKIYQTQENSFCSDYEYTKKDTLFLKRLNFKLRKIFNIRNIYKFIKIAIEKRCSKIKDRKNKNYEVVKSKILKKKVKFFTYDPLTINYNNKIFEIKKIKEIRLSKIKLLKFFATILKKNIENIENSKKYYNKLKCKKFKKYIINTLLLNIVYIIVTELKKKNILIKKKYNCFSFIIIMKNKKLTNNVINIKKKYNLINLKRIQNYENDFKLVKHAFESRILFKNEDFKKEIQNIINKDVIKEKLYIRKYSKLYFYDFLIIEIIFNKITNCYRYVNKKIPCEINFLICKNKINKIIITINKNSKNYIGKKYKYLYYLKKRDKFIVKQFRVKLCSKNDSCYYLIKNVRGNKRKLHIYNPFLQNKINESYKLYNIQKIILKYICHFKERKLNVKIKKNNTAKQKKILEKKQIINNTEGIFDVLIKNNKLEFKKSLNDKNLKLKQDTTIEKIENIYKNRKRNFSTYYLSALNESTSNKINELIFEKNKYNKINSLKKDTFHREINKSLDYCENKNNNSNKDIYSCIIKKNVLINSFDKEYNKHIIEKVGEKEDKEKKGKLFINSKNEEKSERIKIQRNGYKKKCNFVGKRNIKRVNKIIDDTYRNNTKEYLNINSNNFKRELNGECNNNSYFNILDENNNSNISVYNNSIYNESYTNNTTDNNINVYFNYFDKSKIIDKFYNLLSIEKNKIYIKEKELKNGMKFSLLNKNDNDVVINSFGFYIVKKHKSHTNFKPCIKLILKNKYNKKRKKKISFNFPLFMKYLKKKKNIFYSNKYNYYETNEHFIHNNELKKENNSKCSECINVDLYKGNSLNKFSSSLNENKKEKIYKYNDEYNVTEIHNNENDSIDKYNDSNVNCVCYYKNNMNGESYFENNLIDESDFEDNLNSIYYFKNNKQNNYYLSDIFEEKSLEMELSIKSKSENKSAFLRNGENNNIAISSEINEENILNENLMNNRMMDNSSLLYEKESKELIQKNRKKKKKKKKNLDYILNEDLPLESIDNILKNNCDISLDNNNNNEEEKPIKDNIGSDNNKTALENNIDLEVAVMERHSSILINRGIKTKKCVDYSLYNTYAKSSFLQCAEQADNHFIGNYLDRYNDENFYHLRQKIKLCLSRTFANLKTTSETCVLHFTNLIFDLYISRFNSKEEIIDSIINDIVTEEKQFSDVMVQLLKEFYPEIYNDFIYKEQLKNKYKILYQELKESCDLIYHFIAIICLFISQKYYNYRLISIDLIAKTYCKSHLEGLRKVYSLNNELIKDASPDYYSATQYLDTTFSSHSVNKNFALEVEICILKKLNYDLSIPTSYSLLDSLLKANENINFLKVRNDYNSTEGEILLRIANIDNIFLKYKSSTLAMAIYEILNFNICKDKMQRELFDFTKLDDFNHIEEINKEKKKEKDLEEEKKEKEKKNELKFLKRQARSLIIAEEEDRFITASKYINEKTKIYKFIKRIIIKLCFLIKKKIPKSYYCCDYNLSEKLGSHIKRFHESKIMYLNRLKMKKLKKAKKQEDNNIRKEEIEKSSNKNFTEKIHEVGEERSNDTLINVKNKTRENNKTYTTEKQKKCIYESEKEKMLMFDKSNKKILIDNAEERKKKLKEIRDDEAKFQSTKDKIIKKFSKCIKKLIKLKYDDIPIKYCTTYVLEGDELKIYIKKDNDIENRNINTSNRTKRNSFNNVKDTSLKSNIQTKAKNNYIIGTRTKSTDEHLVYYYNYVSKLKSRLIKGLKYFLRRIKKIKSREIYVQKMNMNFLLKKKKRKKKKKEKKIKNISLYKQLLNEIKVFFLWLYKLTNIEIRPLINFSDLKFISIIKNYEKNYSKYILKKLNYMKENHEELNKKIDKKNFENFKISSNSTKKRGETSETNKNHKNISVKKNLQGKKNNVFHKKYIEEVKKTIDGGENIFYSFLKSSGTIKKLKNEENIVEQKDNIKNIHKSNKNVLISKNKECENTKNTTVFYEKNKYMRNKEGKIDEEKKKKEGEKDKDDDALLGKIEHESFEKQKDKFSENVENSHLFSLTNFENLTKINSDWITINDPQVDECAKELMECFLKWKNQNYISKNWTFNEYPNCKEYYFSLVFGDLKSSEALKGIIEMMHMKYNHLLNIYKEINIQK
ncbi:cyclin, putative [Plasmodium relictum]|uniref:Cyclin, putative n=1 Tax=Plasmodium relictum TaxID=85471 RepID=A0A1J1HB26_PLARL|nr:cyclin, putative [Plasmodium relictum]CRH02697.1 cyclin, putative [Plasmodium relictum]